MAKHDVLEYVLKLISGTPSSTNGHLFAGLALES